MALSKDEIVKKFDKMAKLKNRMKKLETEYKTIEKEMLEKYNAKFLHKLGSFTPTSRIKYTMDNCEIAKYMGLKAYKKHSSISKTGIEDGVGQKGFEKLLDQGHVVYSGSSDFYTFRAAKK